MEYAFFCLGFIIITCFITALILDHKLKQHEKKQFYKNLNKLNDERKRNT
jgi:hypothetical protein